MPDLPSLHQRYQQQAEWTSSIRQYLFSQITLPQNARVLELGCGTGAILAACAPFLAESLQYGIDLDFQTLRFASHRDSKANYTLSHAQSLPFADNTFDLIFCHFFLLWAKPLNAILQEALRVLRPGAALIAFAEPDYGARIDFPTALTQLGRWQEESLQQQGAHTRIGRELGLHLTDMGLVEIEVGILGGQWKMPGTIYQKDPELATLQHDLAQIKSTSSEKLTIDALLQIEHQSRREGIRLTYVPTFYGIGKKP